jgi:NADH-quinone oxidoreductase subunit L
MWIQNKALFFGLFLASVCTALYMFRLLFTTFFGDFRGTHDQEHHLHESPTVMTAPLIVLAVLSVVGGFMGVPEALGGNHWLSHYLSPLLSFPAKLSTEEASHATEYMLMAIMIAATVLVMFLVYRSVVVKKQLPEADESLSPMQRVLSNKYYVDEFYEAAVVSPLRKLGSFFNRIIENRIIDGAIRSISTGLQSAGNGTQKLQTGNVGFYVFAMVAGIIAILVYNLFLR